MAFSAEATSANRPFYRAFVGRQFIHGGGVAIFHIASERVVVVHHTEEDHYFLPKGRKDVDEDSITGAEREGFEETGFRNRVLPLAHPTVQTWPTGRKAQFDRQPSQRLHTEPLAIHTSAVGRNNDIQYFCSWYVAETLPPDIEASLNGPSNPRPSNSDGGGGSGGAGGAATTAVPASSPPVYQIPPRSDPHETIAERVALEPAGYAPARQALSTVQCDEVHYFAELVGIDEACRRLHGTGLEYIVREGWSRIQDRMALEREWAQGREKAKA